MQITIKTSADALARVLDAAQERAEGVARLDNLDGRAIVRDVAQLRALLTAEKAKAAAGDAALTAAMQRSPSPARASPRRKVEPMRTHDAPLRPERLTPRERRMLAAISNTAAFLADAASQYFTAERFGAEASKLRPLIDECLADPAPAADGIPAPDDLALVLNAAQEFAQMIGGMDQTQQAIDRLTCKLGQQPKPTVAREIAADLAGALAAFMEGADGLRRIGYDKEIEDGREALARWRQAKEG